MTPKMQQELEERFVPDSPFWNEAVELIELATSEELERCVDRVLSGAYLKYPADPNLDEEQQTRQKIAAMLRDGGKEKPCKTQ